MKKALAVHHRTEAKKRYVHLRGVLLLSGTYVLSYVNRLERLADLILAEKCT